MRRLLAQDILADHRDQIGSRQKAVYGPNAGVARFHYAILFHAHRQAHAGRADALGFSNVRHKVFRDIHFQHSHGSTRLVFQGPKLKFQSRISASGIHFASHAVLEASNEYGISPAPRHDHPAQADRVVTRIAPRREIERSRDQQDGHQYNPYSHCAVPVADSSLPHRREWSCGDAGLHRHCATQSRGGVEGHAIAIPVLGGQVEGEPSQDSARCRSAIESRTAGIKPGPRDTITRAFDVLVRRGACAFPLSSRERTQTGRACFSRTSGLFYSPCAVKGFGRTQLGSRGCSSRFPREPLFTASGYLAVERNHVFKKANAQFGAPTPHEGRL